MDSAQRQRLENGTPLRAIFRPTSPMPSPGVAISEVNGFVISGGGKVDDIKQRYH